ncbi:MAG: cytochrome c oxidase subunit II [Actinobacteria bacterium]|nr:cytochrome c oxidase subunit II [Actinomycetota bacterium]
MTDTRHEYDTLAGLYVPIGAAVVLLVALLVVAFAWRYRARPDDPDEQRRPSRIHRAPRTEALYVLVLACVAALLLWRTYTVEGRTDHAASGRGLGVLVTASKWHWRFDYPRLRIVQRGTDDAPPTLVVPARRTIDFTLRSLDVIHAFWIPDRRFKRDATPGFVSSFSLVFPRTGFWRYGGECSEYCGLRHTWMKFHVAVVSPAAFARWTRARQGGAA